MEQDLKQKQIEEMIDIQRKNCLGKGIGDCVDADCNACSALAFYNAGYRKIPEGRWCKRKSSLIVFSKIIIKI